MWVVGACRGVGVGGLCGAGAPGTVRDRVAVPGLELQAGLAPQPHTGPRCHLAPKARRARALCLLADVRQTPAHVPEAGGGEGAAPGGRRGEVTVLLGELARREPGAGTDAAPPVLGVVVPRHMATPADLRLGGEERGIDPGGLAELAGVKEPAVARP